MELPSLNDVIDAVILPFGFGFISVALYYTLGAVVYIIMNPDKFKDKDKD